VLICPPPIPTLFPYTTLFRSGVGIQGDDVADALGHRGRPTTDWKERGVPGAAKKPVQLMELPALPLPSDPLAFLLIPETPTMQRSEEHTSELQSRSDLVCRLL